MHFRTISQSQIPVYLLQQRWRDLPDPLPHRPATVRPPALLHGDDPGAVRGHQLHQGLQQDGARHEGTGLRDVVPLNHGDLLLHRDHGLGLVLHVHGLQVHPALGQLSDQSAGGFLH